MQARHLCSVSVESHGRQAVPLQADPECRGRRCPHPAGGSKPTRHRKNRNATPAMRRAACGRYRPSPQHRRFGRPPRPPRDRLLQGPQNSERELGATQSIRGSRLATFLFGPVLRGARVLSRLHRDLTCCFQHSTLVLHSRNCTATSQLAEARSCFGCRTPPFDASLIRPGLPAMFRFELRLGDRMSLLRSDFEQNLYRISRP
jgi:hypothetical protein